MRKESGFTLVEVLVVVAIIGILATVAVPAYINYMNRAKQTEAVEALLRSKMDLESYMAENGRYPNTIGCLASFGNTCSQTSVLTSSNNENSYVIKITNSGANSAKVVTANRYITATKKTDTVHITTNDSCKYPVVDTSTSLKFSVFSMIFGK
jgi:type IV pilus assembly protein PilE